MGRLEEGMERGDEKGKMVLRKRVRIPEAAGSVMACCLVVLCCYHVVTLYRTFPSHHVTLKYDL